MAQPYGKRGRAGGFSAISMICCVSTIIFSGIVCTFVKEVPGPGGGLHPGAPGIYPPSLQLKRTNPDPHVVEYLGVKIVSCAQSFLHISVARKELHLPQPVLRYPSLAGDFPVVLAYMEW